MPTGRVKRPAQEPAGRGSCAYGLAGRRYCTRLSSTTSRNDQVTEAQSYG
jgi:hypothetical protein